MLSIRRRAAVITAAAAASLSLALAPMAASAAAGHHGASHHEAAVRGYDTNLLQHSNSARSADNVHRYTMNHKLWKIAHAWAEHLASTGVLAHNPSLVRNVTRACPNWSSTGENVGVVYGDSVSKLFQAYMHSPPHRANILDRHYAEVGIATVKVVRNGITQQWDVMDFGNHC